MTPAHLDKLLQRIINSLFILFFFPASLFSQQLNWAFQAGSSDRDAATFTTTDNASNVLMTGLFSGTVDFDPSAAVFNLTSNGSEDIFVAKYNSLGQFQWAFRIGGTDRDHGLALTTDQNNNVIVTGFFRGANIDFDPSAAVANLTSDGDAGGDPGYGGDIFLAKYNAAGQYQWAFNIGGSQLYDSGISIAVDPSSNIYLGGYFKEIVDFDPSAAVSNLNSSLGTIFLAKYSGSGAYQWAFNTGLGDNDNAVFDLKTDNSGNLYVAGYFQGINIDFDPGPGAALLSSAGGFEIFFAKYTTSGQYVFAKSIGGPAIDVARGIEIDNSGNIYVIGDFTGSNIDFNPGAGTALLSSNGGADVFFAKYDNNGNYIWAFNFGGASDDYGWKVSTDNTHLFITGGFNSTSDMNPSIGIDNLTSNGANDIFLGKYTLNGEYLCSFSIGGPQDDYGTSIKANGTNIFYFTGSFQGNNVDFDPTTSTFNLSSAGSDDIFLSKFTWPDNSPPDGTLAGSVICSGQQAQLTFNATAGTGPFTIVYNNGATDITINNVQSGVPFNINPNPIVSTTYTLVSIRDASKCSETRLINGISNIVNVNQCTGTIINNYTPVLSLNPCTNRIITEDASSISTGDTVLIIQMKGAAIDSSNSSTFGTITSYGNAGNFEFNYVKTVNGNEIEFLNKLTRQYDIPNAKVQLVRVPYYQSLDINSNITCPSWDGFKGGVIVFNVADTLKINNSISADGKGFRGGNDPFSNPISLFCYENQFYYPPNPDLASEKGESIYDISSLKSFGKGANANGGGSGNSHNSGGGGGGNGNAGGFGGYNYELTPCNVTVPFDNRGLGGKGLIYSNADNKIFLGGGGGAGQSNNPEGFEAMGGNGGGIIIIKSRVIVGNNNSVSSKGIDGLACSGLGVTGCHEGMGGAGAGGTILLQASSYVGNLNINSSGGKGADMIVGGFGRLGPGGGGSGGVTWLSSTATPSGVTVQNNGGPSGVNTNYSNDPWGATAGQAGQTLFNLNLPFDNTLFKPNIDSVRIKDSITICTAFDFKGQGYTNTNPIASWQWYFGDGQTTNAQITSHTYTPGTYTVKLVATDINGCIDSVTKNVTASSLSVNAGNDTTICKGQSIILQASTNGGTQFQWAPISFLDNNAILNPIATPPDGTTTFILNATNASGCSQTDSIKIFVRAQNSFSINAPGPICRDDSIQIIAQGGDIYSWQPSAGINSTTSNPFVKPQTSTTYSVQITDTLCNFSDTLSTLIKVLPLPNVRAYKQNDIDCVVDFSQLNASGATTYLWSPPATLSNPNIQDPVARPVMTTQYVVKGTDEFGCSNNDTLIVNVNNAGLPGGYLMPSAFTPNNDGLNDCYGIKYWGAIIELEFSIFNRWGERVFHTTNPADCWNGKFKGVEQKSDVYVYWIRAKTSCESSVFKKGVFALIR